MSKLRIFFVVSLVILGVLAVFTIFRPMATGGEYSETQRESLLKTEEGWVIQYELINREEKEQNYTIWLTIDGGKPYEEDVMLREGKKFTFIRRLSSQELSSGEGEVKITIYKEGEVTPFEEAVYYLRQSTI